jgi:hypothetical protein
MARTTEKEEIPEATDDPWSTVPEAAIERFVPFCYLDHLASREPF